MYINVSVFVRFATNELEIMNHLQNADLHLNKQIQNNKSKN